MVSQIGIYILDNMNTPIGTSILAALRTFTFSLFEIILRTIVNLFDVFELLARSTLIKSESIQIIYNKVGLILGLFMVFRITFSFIQYVINPDLMSDQKKGYSNIVKKIIIIMILLGSTRSIFSFARDLQDKIIHENIVGRVILGSSENDINMAGKDMAYTILQSFYRINEETKSNNDYNACEKILIGSGDNDSLLEKEFKDKNSLDLAYNCLEQTQVVDVDGGVEQKQVFVINFEWFLALVTGLLILYIICVYTIQVAVRSIQLAYLEMIAPIPIMMYITPKGDEKLQNWASQCLTTFLDVFLRIALLYFVIFACDEISDSITTIQATLQNSSDGSVGGWIYVRVIVIIAILIFTKKVPDLIKEIFPSFGGKASLGFGLKMPKEAKTVLGAGAGAIAGGTVGLLGGRAITGAISGAISGAKGKKYSEIAAARGKQNRLNRQTTAMARAENGIRKTFGLESGSEAIDNRIKDLDKKYQKYDREYQEQIYEIDNNALMKEYAKNDTIISSYKAIKDEAEKELLKPGKGNSTLINKRNDIDFLKQNIGKQININGEKDKNGKPIMKTIDSQMIYDTEEEYNELLKQETSKWIDNNKKKNLTVARNMQIISQESGTVYNDDESISSQLDGISEKAKISNSTNASKIVELEYKKKELGKEHDNQKKEFENQKRELENQKKQFPS